MTITWPLLFELNFSDYTSRSTIWINLTYYTQTQLSELHFTDYTSNSSIWTNFNDYTSGYTKLHWLYLKLCYLGIYLKIGYLKLLHWQQHKIWYLNLTSLTIIKALLSELKVSDYTSNSGILSYFDGYNSRSVNKI